MKRIASALALIGVASGVFIALAPWIYGAPRPAAASFVLPVLGGIVIMATHWFTFRRIQVGSGSLLGLLLPNVALLTTLLLGLIFMPPSPGNGDAPTLKMLLQATAYVLPFVSNILYLSFTNRSSGGYPHGS
jgi:hypothetical protein